MGTNEIGRQGTGADSAAVVFDALNAAEARGIDTVIVDTAGRVERFKQKYARAGVKSKGVSA